MNSVAFQHHRQSEHVIRFSFLSYFARISVSDGVAEGGEVGRKLVPHLQESGACSRPQSGSRARLGRGVGVEVETADARGASNRKCKSSEPGEQLPTARGARWGLWRGTWGPGGRGRAAGLWGDALAAWSQREARSLSGRSEVGLPGCGQASGHVAGAR